MRRPVTASMRAMRSEFARACSITNGVTGRAGIPTGAWGLRKSMAPSWLWGRILVDFHQPVMPRGCRHRGLRAGGSRRGQGLTGAGQDLVVARPHAARVQAHPDPQQAIDVVVALARAAQR